MLHVFGVAAMALGVAGMLLLAGHIAWQEVQRLAYLSRLDEWASEVDTTAKNCALCDGKGYYNVGANETRTCPYRHARTL